MNISFRVYEDASAACAKEASLTVDGSTASVCIPADADAGDQIHVIVKAQNDSRFKLVHYQQVIITITE